MHLEKEENTCQLIIVVAHLARGSAAELVEAVTVV